jgi:hypothetical protein
MVNSKLYISAGDGSGFTIGSYLISAYTDTNNITISTSAGANATLGAGVINDKTVLAYTNMTQGPSTLIWFYDYVTAEDAPVGSYYIATTAVIDGTTYYAIDDYVVSPADAIIDADSDAWYD